MKELNPKIWQDSYKFQYEAYPFFTSVYLLAVAEPENKYFISFDNFLNFFDHGQLTAFQPRKVFLRKGDKIIRDLLSGNDEYLVELNRIHRIVRKEINFCLSLRQSDKVKNSSFWWPRLEMALSLCSKIIFGLDYPLDDFLKKLYSSNQDIYRAFLERTKASRQSFIDAATRRLVGLSKGYPDNFDKIYNIFVEEYGWLRNSYEGKFNITKSWLERYLSQIVKTKIKKNKEMGRLVELPQKYELLSKTVSQAIVFRDDKKKLFLLGVELMDRWLRAYCKENGLNFKEMRWLSMGEILSGNHLIKAKKAELLGRRLGIATPLGYDDVSLGLWKKVQKVQSSKEIIREIKGLAANPGFTRGTVKIILDVSLDSHKFNNGDILVTSMTRPEFISFMKRASAFITDEGGITCHAAIISRELGKPCIIGTKIATQILKDGDIIEVDANKGIIKIINKK